MRDYQLLILLAALFACAALIVAGVMYAPEYLP